jgi:hypothetical protein
VALICNRRFVETTKEQMAALMVGFEAVIPQRLISLFDPDELELLIGGIHVIDVGDWSANTRWVTLSC